ncbi:MAG: hypothetical protein ACYDBQ_06895 [Thermoplasmatota archaeon]
MTTHFHHQGSKEAWNMTHKDQEPERPIPNIDEDWNGEPVILEI